MRYALIAPILVVCVALAWAMDRHYDRPVRRWLKRLSFEPAVHPVSESE